jgi:hypothetical protein
VPALLVDRNRNSTSRRDQYRKVGLQEAIPRLASNSGRITGNPEVISSPVGLVPTNALVLSGPANFRVVGNPEVIQDLPVNRSTS